MYNTDFKVKYNDIREELMFKIKNKTQENLDVNSDQEYEYNIDDIDDICDKLYRDEFLSVFYADNDLDDKVDDGINYVLEKMLENPNFKLLIDKLNNLISMDIGETQDLTGEEKDSFMPNIDLLSILTLFKKEFFYVFHKCICQQLTLGTIDAELLDELKKITMGYCSCGLLE